MSDVSSRLVQGHVDFLATRGHDLDDLYKAFAAGDPSDENLRREIISDPRKRIPWNSWATACEVIGHFYPDPASRRAFFEYGYATDKTWFPYLRTLARLTIDCTHLYSVFEHLVMPAIFGDSIETRVEKISGEELKITIKISEELRPAPVFLDFASYAITKIPMILGLPDAIVEGRVFEREGVFIVKPPRLRTFWTKFKQIALLIFRPQQVLNELIDRDQANRADYKALQESEQELRSIKAALEERVHERTRELEAQVTEILKKEDENRHLSAQIAHLQKLEALGTLVGGISHEINNVLHGILLANTAAKNALEADHSAQAPLDIERKFALRGQEVMRQVLAFSRKVEIKRRALAITPIVQELLKLMRATLPKNIEIHEEYQDSGSQPLAILGDETQLQQIMVNLISNAAHAMSARGGVLTVRVSRDAKEYDALIEVIDRGDGIPEAVRERIFEPFFTTKAVGEGAGMGLAVVYGLVQTFGGRIDFESKIGMGSTFRVHLPLTQMVEINTINDLDFLEAGGHERVLLIDDESELLEVLRDTLSTLGYVVTTANSGKEALATLGKAEVDLVITDQIMPGMLGTDLATEIKKRWPFLPIVLCTGYNEIGDLSSIMDPFDGRVLKPIDAIELGSVMRTVLINRAPRSPRFIQPSPEPSKMNRGERAARDNHP